MNIYLLFIILISLALYFFFIDFGKSRNKSRNARLEILKWMEMTREQRHAFDEGQKKSTFKRKRRLLDQIRKEYASLDSKKNYNVNNDDKS